ncbi:alpha/beta hydrolase family protein [Nonomuraea jiangxiensis]|uniref:2,6-dihydroxypseudooxynicotine hydrolase n=1 Tax=Nonomuraea jiangxiensis TaxID=633440 RepID=A0A1G9F8K7_9ACTN|nr:alpha/beta hydrolase [Nonomuraea jiangxiensis]SDK84680.1 2,6-dihydroxypseudooxynicotine hydrolase [Nonomuraea jiangxiensis]
MDELVASAVSHWAPRFTTNGVAVADFERVISGLKDWDGWCSAWSAVGAEYEALGAEAVREGRLRSAGQHYVQAAVCHHFGKYLFVQDPVQMREAHLAAVRCLDAALPHLDPPGRRIEIPFEGSRLVGVLRLPHGPGPHPVVVMIPGLDSAKEEFRSTEALFLERGVGTFSVDGPGQGEAEYDLAIRGDWEVPGAAILDAVSAEPDIAADRLAVWGVSLGGYYAPRVASGDGRVRACVALAGPYDFGECWDQLPDLTRNAFRARSRAENDEHAREIAHSLSLAGRTGSITCPLLVVTGRRDRLIPWQHAARLVDEVGGTARLLLLDEGNHGCMNVAAHHRQKTADWVAAQLGAGE